MWVRLQQWRCLLHSFLISLRYKSQEILSPSLDGWVKTASWQWQREKKISPDGWEGWMVGWVGGERGEKKETWRNPAGGFFISLLWTFKCRAIWEAFFLPPFLSFSSSYSFKQTLIFLRRRGCVCPLPKRNEESSFVSPRRTPREAALKKNWMLAIQASCCLQFVALLHVLRNLSTGRDREREIDLPHPSTY